MESNEDENDIDYVPASAKTEQNINDDNEESKEVYYPQYEAVKIITNNFTLAYKDIKN